MPPGQFVWVAPDGCGVFNTYGRMSIPVPESASFPAVEKSQTSVDGYGRFGHALRPQPTFVVEADTTCV